MNRPLFITLLLVAGLHGAVHGSAQTVWRCGPDGRSYSSQPCSDGRAIELPGARPQADVLAAGRAAAAEQRLAAQLRVERLQREREHQARGPGLSGFARATAPASVKPQLDRQAKLTPKRQALSPEAGGTSTKAARASRRTPG